LLLTLLAKYAEQDLRNGQVSVNLSLSSIDHCSSMRLVCCWAPRGQEISINSGRWRAPSSNGAAAAQQHYGQQQMRAVSGLPPQKAKHVGLVINAVLMMMLNLDIHAKYK